MGTFDNRDQRPNTTRRLRLRGWDYSTPGFYFITVTTHNRQELFWEADADSNRLSPAGSLMQQVVLESQRKFSSISVDCFVVMPDHIHILFGLGVGIGDEPHQSNIIDVMQWIKLVTVKRYTMGVKNGQLQPYQRKLWQDGFYDSISFSDKELEAFRKYIVDNPLVWRKGQV